MGFGFPCLAMNSYIIICVIIANASHTIYSKHRTHRRTRDFQSNYPYIVYLLRQNSINCVGTLVSPEWVITAAHCIHKDVTEVRYKDLQTAEQKNSAVIQRVPHPAFRKTDKEMYGNDIGLCQINPIVFPIYGKPSAVDYITLIGYAVTYANYNHSDGKEIIRISDGVVTECNSLLDNDNENAIGPYLCTAPKCSETYKDSTKGETGSPLFCDGKIIGIKTVGPDKLALSIYTAVSPFLTWIHKQMLSNANSETSDLGTNVSKVIKTTETVIISTESLIHEDLTA